MKHTIKTTLGGKPYIVTIDATGVDISPEGADGTPDPTNGMAVWVDPYRMEEEGALLIHAYRADDDAPTSLRLTPDAITYL
jgi:hypothetical protein